MRRLARLLPAPVRRAGGRALAAVYSRSFPISPALDRVLTEEDERLAGEVRSLLTELTGPVRFAPITPSLLEEVREGLYRLDAGGPRG
ncbi:hypothetical protein [Sinosporangium album]|uniref:hypothetical protein n=1 Tax=Sinosporangium album TaxID=504805 RepID=UPI000B84E9AD|nr:hypothetical protein [Sinosporangium album]